MTVDTQTTDDALNQLEKDIVSAASLSTKGGQAAKADIEPDKKSGREAAGSDDVEAKFAGKSANELIQMYKNLESSHGRLANDLGVQRQLTDRLLDLKRSADLTSPAARAEAVKVRSEDLLDNPGETLEKVISAQLAKDRGALDERLRGMEQSIAQAGLRAKHPDLDDYPNSPEFVAWVQASPTRSRAAALAVAGDVQAIDALVSEYKASKRSKDSAVDGDASKANDVRRATLEGGSGGVSKDAAAAGGKTYSRAALMKLRTERPDRYYRADFQQEIQRAYLEKRVK